MENISTLVVPRVSITTQHTLLLDNCRKYKMRVTFIFIPIALGILVIISVLACFLFIYKRLKINHIIKKILLFATGQQAIGFGIFVSSLVPHVFGFKNKLTCFLTITSLRASVIGTQTSISAISIIRYSISPQ